MAIRTILTYEDYAALPADGRRYELHEGKLSVTPAPSPRHQQVIRNLCLLLHAHVQDHRSGEVLFAPIDCILSDTTIVQPDLVYLNAARSTSISARGIEGPPTLMIEVLSPSTRSVDRGAKAQLYARYGVPYYWIADPDLRTIDAYELVEGQYRLAGRVEGDSRTSLAPFSDLTLAPDSIWP